MKRITLEVDEVRRITYEWYADAEDAPFPDGQYDEGDPWEGRGEITDRLQSLSDFADPFTLAKIGDEFVNVAPSPRRSFTVTTMEGKDGE